MTTPREAFAEFETLERCFGLDDSPLLVLLRALVDSSEHHEKAIEAHGTVLARLVKRPANES